MKDIAQLLNSFDFDGRKDVGAALESILPKAVRCMRSLYAMQACKDIGELVKSMTSDPVWHAAATKLGMCYTVGSQCVEHVVQKDSVVCDKLKWVELWSTLLTKCSVVASQSPPVPKSDSEWDDYTRGIEKKAKGRKIPELQELAKALGLEVIEDKKELISRIAKQELQNAKAAEKEMIEKWNETRKNLAEVLGLDDSEEKEPVAAGSADAAANNLDQVPAAGILGSQAHKNARAARSLALAMESKLWEAQRADRLADIQFPRLSVVISCITCIIGGPVGNGTVTGPHHSKSAVTAALQLREFKC